MGVLVVVVGLLCVRLVEVRPQLPADPFSCVSIRGDRWNMLPGVEYTGRIKAHIPAGDVAGLSLIVGDSLPLAIEAESIDGKRVPVRMEPINPNHTPIDYWLEYGSPWLAPRRVAQGAVDAQPHRAQTIIVNLGRRAPRVLARLTGYPDDTRGRICAAPVAASPAFVRARHLEIVPAEHAYFADGWYGLEMQRPLGTVRWMSDHGVLLVPSSRDGTVRARLRAVSPDGDEGEATSITLKVNDVYEAQPRAMTANAATYEWVIPDTAWLAGTNELLLSVSHTAHVADAKGNRRRLGLALQKLMLTIEGGDRSETR